MAKHRCRDAIQSALNKGHDFLILQGNGIDDDFFYDLYYGVRNVSDNIKLMFLLEFGYQYVIHISDKGVPVVFAAGDKKGGICDVTEQYFAPDEYEPDEDDALGNIGISDETKSGDDAKQLENKVSELSPELRRNLIQEKLEQKNCRTLIFFERFDYYSKLYTQDTNEQIAGIRYIHQLLKHNKCTVMISLSNAEKLTQFDIRTNGSNVIFIGNPSAEEIRNTFLRAYLRYLPKDTAFTLDSFRRLDNVADVLASSDKLLKQAISVFRKIVIDRQQTQINPKEFEIAAEKITTKKVSLDDVILEESTKDSVLKAVESFLKADERETARKGIILTGPPGTGKTHICKAIASEKNCYFLAPTLADLKGEYVGQSSAKVRKIFSQARSNSPTILFLDEADTIFPNRSGGEDGDSYTRDMVNQFLVEIDGLTSDKQKIFVIAATNRVDIIDPAIRSRLKEVIEIPLPDKKMRITMFDKFLSEYNISFREKPFSDMIADRTHGMSGRDIDNIVKKLHENAGDSLSSLTNDQLTELFMKVLEDERKQLLDELRRDGVEVYSPEHPAKTYQDIIGYDDVKKKIDIQIRNIRATDEERLKAKQLNIYPNKGILLYGPPGNGKTDLVKAIAGEYGFYLIKVISKDFVSDLQQDQLKRLQSIFDRAIRLEHMLAHENKGIILFFDEFDALAGMNSLSKAVRGTLLDYMTNPAFRSIDSRLLFVAATNFYGQLDEALIRRGRIDTHICLDCPSEKDGREILRSVIRKDQSIDQKSINDSQINDAYDKLTKTIQEHYYELHQNDLRMISSILSERRDEAIKKIDEEAKRQRPSIADILNYYEESKTNSFYSSIGQELINLAF